MGKYAVLTLNFLKTVMVIAPKAMTVQFPFWYSDDALLRQRRTHSGAQD